MSRAFIKRFSFVTLLLIMVFTVIACDDTEDPVDPIDPVTYTVTFNTNEGSAVASIDVEENDKVTKPADPTKEGFTFEYWYTTDEAVEFDFNTAITADIILNA
ncbi:MAG: InlB B-repeat-containing protein, partial [Acholeplasmataceae bacterium]